MLVNWALSAPVVTEKAAVGARFTVTGRVNSVEDPPSLLAISVTV